MIIDNKIQVLEALFTEALGKSKSERSNWIKTLNQPESLKSELDELLKVSDSDLDFFTRLKTDINEKLESEFQDFEVDNGFKIGPYSIINRIAKGGMSNVYLAKRVEGDFEQSVAVKIINGFLASKSGKDQFKLERNILSELQHPNIAQIFDGGVIKNELPYFVMELINGVDFLTFHKNRGEPEVLTNFLQLLKGLSYAHKRGVIHHDLKPQNVLIDQSGFVKILDFGIAIKTKSGSEVKNLQSLFLSPEYASPEQKSGAQISVASDIYQAGLILKNTLFESGNTIVPELNAIIEKSLKFEPEERFASINDFSKAITDFIHGHPVKEYSLSDFYKVKKWISRNRVTSIFIALLISSIVIGIVSFANQFKSKSDALVLAQKEKQKSDEIKNYLFELIESANPEVNLGDTLSIYELLKKGKNKIIGDSLNSGLSLEVALEMSRMYKKMGDYRNADSILSYVIYSIEGSKLSEDILILNDAKFEKAELNSRLSLYKDSDSLLQHILAQRGENKEWVSDTVWLKTLHEKAVLCAHIFREHEKADSLLNLLLREYKVRSPDRPDYLGLIYNTNGINEEYQSNYGKAIEYYNKAIEALSLRYNEHVTKILDVKLQVAAMHVNIGSLDSAAIISQEILKSSLEYYGTLHPQIQKVYNYLGYISRKSGENAEAISHYKKSLKIIENLYSEGSINSKHNHNNIGRAFHRMGYYDSAIIYYDSALIYSIKFLGEEDVETAYTKMNLAESKIKLQEYESAMELLLQVNMVFEKKLSKSHKGRRDVLTQIAKAKYARDPNSDWEKYIIKSGELFQEFKKNVIDGEALSIDLTYMDILAEEGRKNDVFKYFQRTKQYLIQNKPLASGSDKKLLRHVEEIMGAIDEPDSLKAFALLIEAYKERNSN